MARSRQTKGLCSYCKNELTRSGMTRHLRGCTQRLDKIRQANARGRREKQYHLQVQDAYGLGYWLQLEMRGRATLEDLDWYLRVIWLECCGHLSDFTIRGQRYTQLTPGLFDFGMEKESMDIKVDRVLKTGLEIDYEYDFGSSTNLTIKVVGQRTGGATTKNPIALMARNNFEPPPCDECGKPTRWMCLDCYYGDEEAERGFACEEHAKAHEEHDEHGGPMGFFNSPRSGVCGYDGPAEPPY